MTRQDLLVQASSDPSSSLPVTSKSSIPSAVLDKLSDCQSTQDHESSKGSQEEDQEERVIDPLLDLEPLPVVLVLNRMLRVRRRGVQRLTITVVGLHVWLRGSHVRAIIRWRRGLILLLLLVLVVEIVVGVGLIGEGVLRPLWLLLPFVLRLLLTLVLRLTLRRLARIVLSGGHCFDWQNLLST